MRKLLAFDLDGTLAPSKSPVPERICQLLSELLRTYEICVISGGAFKQFEMQLLLKMKVRPQRLERVHVMPTCGTRYYRFERTTEAWKMIYAEDFGADEKKTIANALREVAHELGWDTVKSYGDQLEDRGSQISWSALGQDIVDVLGERGVRIKEKWDPDKQKKERMRELLIPKLPGYEIRSGGLTTIDITKRGIDKAYGMQKLIDYLNIKKEDILFFGDRLGEGGNDYPVKEMGIDCIEVSGPEDTLLALRAIASVI